MVAFTVKWRELRDCQMDLTMTEAMAVVTNNGTPPLEPDTAPKHLAEALERMGADLPNVLANLRAPDNLSIERSLDGVARKPPPHQGT